MRGLWRKLGWVVLVGVAGASLWACTNPPVFPDTPNHFITFNPVFLDSLPGTSTALRLNGAYDGDNLAYVTLSQAEWDALPRLWCYQVWAISRNGSVITKKASTPKFLWDPYQHVARRPDGTLFRERKFNLQADITEFDEVVLTIEPYPDYFSIRATADQDARIEVVDKDILSPAGSSPDLSFLEVGDLSPGRTSYTMRFPVADDLDTAHGTYFLANTTAGESTSSSITSAANYGIWFGEPEALGGGAIAINPSLALPALPSGWIYEGWVIPPDPNPKDPISTGRFANPAGPDDDSSYSGERKVAATLPIPGEDFLANPPGPGYTFPMTLWSVPSDTAWAFITIEPNDSSFIGIDPENPSPDISSGPFSYRVLQLRLPAPALDPSEGDTTKPYFDPFDLTTDLFPMANMHGKFPKFGQPGAPLVEIKLSSQ